MLWNVWFFNCLRLKAAFESPLYVRKMIVLPTLIVST